MFKTLRHYLSVYYGFCLARLSEQMSFRLHFVLLVLLDIIFYASSLATVHFLYDHVALVGPWNKNQLLFFISFMLLIDQLHMALISESFWILSFDLKSGNMDYHFLRPLNSIFTIFFQYIRPSGIPTFFIVWGLAIHYGMKVPLGFWDWVLLPFLVLLGLSFLVLIEILLSTSMFWMTEGVGVNFFRNQMQQAARWPDFIYKRTSSKLFLILLPFLLVGSAPVRFLFDKGDWKLLAAMIVALLILTKIVQRFWELGARHYESASS